MAKKNFSANKNVLRIKVYDCHKFVDSHESLFFLSKRGISSYGARVKSICSVQSLRHSRVKGGNHSLRNNATALQYEAAVCKRRLLIGKKRAERVTWIVHDSNWSMKLLWSWRWFEMPLTAFVHKLEVFKLSKLSGIYHQRNSKLTRRSIHQAFDLRAVSWATEETCETTVGGSKTEARVSINVCSFLTRNSLSFSLRLPDVRRTAV